MREPITSKSRMYRLLSQGLLGNTIPQYFDLAQWEAGEDFWRYSVWGVRTLTPGGPCRLFCPRDEVRATAESFAPHPVNVSVMIDAVADVTLMADISVGVNGLEVYGIEAPPKGCNWRKEMPRLAKTYTLTAAKVLLAKRLNPNSLADLHELLEAYPAHAVELSACEQELGIVPGRNAVVWEVRCLSGEYERDSWR